MFQEAPTNPACGPISDYTTLHDLSEKSRFGAEIMGVVYRPLEALVRLVWHECLWHYPVLTLNMPRGVAPPGLMRAALCLPTPAAGNDLSLGTHRLKEAQRADEHLLR